MFQLLSGRPLLRVALVLLLGGAAYLINCVPLSLSFGLHFLFGGLLAMLTAILYGPWEGAAVAALSALPTLRLWGHPFAILTMTLEALVVGLESRRGRHHYTEIDLLYWILVGGPLVIVTYSIGAHIPLMATGVAALKQAVNGLVNTSGASMLALGLVWWQRGRRQLPLEVVLSNLIAFLVLFPLAFSLVLTIRDSGQQLRDQLTGEAVRAGGVVRAELVRELVDHRWALVSLAMQEGSSARLEPGLTRVWLLDQAGRVLARYPADSVGYPTDLPDANPSGLTNVEGLAGKTVLIDEPVSPSSGKPWTRAVAALDLDRMADRVLAPIDTSAMEVAVADRTGNVLFSSWQGVQPGATLVRDLGQLELFHAPDQEGEASREYPEGSPSYTSLQQAEQLVFVNRLDVPELGWQVYVRKPLGVVENTLYRSYLRSFLLAVALITLLMLAIRLITFTVTRPLVQVAGITVTPEGELANLPAHQGIWVEEVLAVTAHLKGVGARIQSLVQSLQETQRQLQQRNVELAVANIHLADEALRDPETGLHNQRAFWQQVELWVEENRPFTLLLADLPAEADIGRLAGELQQNAALHGGEAYRYSSERLACLFPESSEWLVDRMVLTLRSVSVDGVRAVQVGAARFPEDGSTGKAVVAAADRGLKYAKKGAH